MLVSHLYPIFLILIETPKKAIILNYINESSPVYHSSSLGADVAPRDSYINDYQNFIKDYSKRIFLKTVVYSLNPGNRLFKWYQEFQNHLQQAIDGTGYYAHFPTKLRPKGFEYRLSVPASRPPEQFFEDIQEILDEAKRG